MVRTVAAVVMGYVTVVALSIASAGLSWAIFGAEGAFAPGSTVASMGWAVSSCVFGFVAAVVAGAVAAAIGEHPTNLPVKVLAGFMLVFGLLLAFFTMGVEPPPLPEGKSIGELTFVEAGQVASNPVWYLFAIPIIGFIGVFVGGMRGGGASPGRHR